MFYSEDDAGTEYQLWDDLKERVMPGAFDRAIREDDCRALFNHNADCILGRTSSGTCRLSVDQKGLRYEIDAPDTQAARDVMESLKRGDLTGSSFSFMIRSQAWREVKDEEGKYTLIREVEEVELFDVGPVTFPAYSSTSASMRAIGPSDLLQVKAAAEEWRAKSWRPSRAHLLKRQQLAELEA